MLSNEQLKQLGIDEQDFSQLNEAERNLVIQILDEMQNTGTSNTFNDLVKEDYTEMPVDILTFVDDYNYLGNAWHDAQGNSKLYPYWREELVKIFPDNVTTAVNNGIFTGSRGRGKSEICILIAAYLLHRILCLKNPIAYYHLKPTEKIVFAFMNIKLALAEEIGVSKFQNTIQSSPWFMEHGELVGRTNKLWVPKKFNGQEAIDIKIGSKADDLVGLPVYFCLDGNTPILTDNGVYNISSLENQKIRVATVSNTREVIYSDECTVKQTAESSEEYVIELEDETIIKCTPSHRFMLVNGEYKEAQYLTETDELLDFIPYGYVYKTTNLINNKIYIGQHKGMCIDKNYLGSGHLFARAIHKYGRNNFKVEILELCDSKEHLDQREIYYINLYNSVNHDIGYNIAYGGQGGDLGPIVRQRISEHLKNKPKTQEHRRRLSEANKGKHLSEDTKRKISEGNRGKTVSDETRKKMSDSAKSSNREWRCPNKGMLAITDGLNVRYIKKTDLPPDGWRFGNCHTAKPHNMDKYYSDSERRVKNSLAHSGNKNSMWGKGYTITGGNNPNSHIRYYFDGNTFECRKDLVFFLKENVDANISSSLIRSIEHGTYKNRTLKKYPFIINNLTWETK